MGQVEREPVQEGVGDQLRKEEAGREGEHPRDRKCLPNPYGIPPVLFPGATGRAGAAVLLVGARSAGLLGGPRSEANVLRVRC